MNEGQRFGAYLILQRLGRGAMGDVYLARNQAGEDVALKVVYRGPEPDDQEVVEAERVGAELQKRLAAVDPRIVRVHRTEFLDHSLAIEMEYIAGEDLSMRLSRGALEPAEAARIGAALCLMLENLARFSTEIEGRQFVGVVHGDLKPRNIRINPAGELKVLDFGIAKALSLTRKYTSNIFASAAYCSPERLETQTIDMRSDLWSVGVLLYQMATARLPFDAPNRERLERRVRSADPPDPMPPEVPAPFRDIVFQMLARDPDARYQSAAELREDLERFLAGAPVLARPAPVAVAAAGAADLDATVRTTAPAADATVRTTAPVPLEPQPPRAAAPVVLRVRGNRSRMLTGCMTVLATLVAVAVLFTGQQLSVWKSAQKFQHELDTEHVTDFEAAWKQFQALDSRMHLPGMMWGVRRSLKSRLVAAGDQVISEYRDSESPSVKYTQWKQARALFDHALEIDPGDDGVRGRIRLTEGHMSRIEAARSPSRVKLLNTAAAKFNEAAALLKRSPDPYLGLARLYAYELNDVERAEEALRQAAKYGHPTGTREKAQLADGYRRRGDRTWRDSRAFSDLPEQEKQYLEQARKDYLKAEELYREIGLWEDSAQARAGTLSGLERVEQRLFQLEGGQPKERRRWLIF